MSDDKRLIILAKADDTIRPIPNCMIEIAGPLPECDSIIAPVYRPFYEKFYGEQARLLADELFRCLPGGTLDALLGEILHRKASIFRVPYDEGTNDVGD